MRSLLSCLVVGFTILTVPALAQSQTKLQGQVNTWQKAVAADIKFQQKILADMAKAKNDPAKLSRLQATLAEQNRTVQQSQSNLAAAQQQLKSAPAAAAQPVVANKPAAAKPVPANSLAPSNQVVAPSGTVGGAGGNLVSGGAGNLVSGGAGNLVSGGAGNLVSGGAGNLVSGGAGNAVPQRSLMSTGSGSAATGPKR
jgi:hypothetical protein